MKKLLLLVIIAVGFVSCEKETLEPIVTESKLRTSSNYLINENWRMEYYVENGISTMGDNSIWDFKNNQIHITSTIGEVSINYQTNGYRVYIEDANLDVVNEFFIDYLSKDSLFMSSQNVRYSFVNAQ